jgi:hypothetical protein
MLLQFSKELKERYSYIINNYFGRNIAPTIGVNLPVKMWSPVPLDWGREPRGGVW